LWERPLIDVSAVEVLGAPEIDGAVATDEALEAGGGNIGVGEVGAGYVRSMKVGTR
jgi:hypothetical protein